MVSSTEAPPGDAVPDPGPPCTACHTALASGAKFCPECGTALKAATATSPEEEVLADTEERSGQQELRPARRAPDPEVDAQEEPEERTIDAVPVPGLCGHVLPPDAQFCPTCGARVGQMPARCSIKVLAPDEAPVVHDLKQEEVTIGKDPQSDIVIAGDDYVSRHHAKLVRSDGLFYLEDLRSSNGTLLRIRRPIVLEAGDEIVIGTTVLQLEMD